MAVLAIAQVAGVGLLQNQLDQGISAQTLSQTESLRLVDPHQWRIEDEPSVHRTVQGQLNGFDRIVSTIGVSRKVGLAHTAHDVSDVSLMSDDRRQYEKENVAPRYKGGWESVGIHRNGCA